MGTAARDALVSRAAVPKKSRLVARGAVPNAIHPASSASSAQSSFPEAAAQGCVNAKPYPASVMAVGKIRPAKSKPPVVTSATAVLLCQRALRAQTATASNRKTRPKSPHLIRETPRGTVNARVALSSARSPFRIRRFSQTSAIADIVISRLAVFANCPVSIRAKVTKIAQYRTMKTKSMSHGRALTFRPLLGTWTRRLCMKPPVM